MENREWKIENGERANAFHSAVLSSRLSILGFPFLFCLIPALPGWVVADYPAGEDCSNAARDSHAETQRRGNEIAARSPGRHSSLGCAATQQTSFHACLTRRGKATIHTCQPDHRPECSTWRLCYARRPTDDRAPLAP